MLLPEPYARRRLVAHEFRAQYCRQDAVGSDLGVSALSTLANEALSHPR